MYRSLILFNLFFCYLPFLHAEENLHDQVRYPPLWNVAPSSLRDYPSVNGTPPYRVIDPWLYPHRLGLYKILIDVTTPLMPFCASSNASNILFALPSQFGWQFESNRLFTNGTLDISTDSWWASANYYMSVVPFLVAVDVGLIPPETFHIVQREGFCSNSTDCLTQVPKAMKQWHLFFSGLLHSGQLTDARTIDHYYLAPMWSAYTASIENALPLIKAKLGLLPSPTEQSFGQAWARLVSLIAMTRKNTNLYETLKNQRSFLPSRMLVESDRLIQSNDLPDLVNGSLELLFGVQFDWLVAIEFVWKKMTCNYEGRIYAQQAIESIANSKLFAVKCVSQALLSAVFFQCDRPFKNDL